MILVSVKHRILLLDTFKTTGTGPFSKYLFPASHKERVPVIASSTVAPAEQLGSSFLGQSISIAKSKIVLPPEILPLERSCSSTMVTTQGTAPHGTGQRLKIYFFCKDWIYIAVKIKLKIEKTLKTMHFHFDGLTLKMLREALDIFLEQNPDLTEEEVANPERMVGAIQIFKVEIFSLSY